MIFSLYRLLLSPFIQVGFNIHCRYEESCSRYFERALKEQGFLRGFWSGLKRILSCNGFSSKPLHIEFKRSNDSNG